MMLFMYDKHAIKKFDCTIASTDRVEQERRKYVYSTVNMVR
jgi:hypothetical protein